MGRTRWHERAVDEHPHLTKFTDEAVSEIFARRKIADDVWHGRAYVPYHAGDVEAVLHAEPRFAGSEFARYRSWLAGVVNQRPGLVMQRHALPGTEAISAQLRPFRFRDVDPTFDVKAYGVAEDDGVWRRDHYHDHYRKLQTYHTERACMVINVDSHRFDPNAKPWTQPKKSTHEYAVEAHVNDQHDGKAPPLYEVHEHPSVDLRHITKAHDGKRIRYRHNHPEHAKYLYTPGEDASRIDVHPMAWPLIERGGRVCYFALEGLLKSDAILSQDYTGPLTGTPVVDCGSVTLWDDRTPVLYEGAAIFALDWLARRYLSRFGRVVIVPDSDAIGNRMVMTQARELADRLSNADCTPIVALPPAKCGHTCPPEHWNRPIGKVHGEDIYLPDPTHKNGIDDYLGGGGKLRNLAAQKTVTTTKTEPDIARRRVDQFERDTDVLEYLRRVCSDDGIVVTSLRKIGTGVGRDASNVGPAIKSLEAQGLLSIVDASAFWDENAPASAALPRTAVKLHETLVPEREYVPLGDVLDGDL